MKRFLAFLGGIAVSVAFMPMVASAVSTQWDWTGSALRPFSAMWNAPVQVPWIVATSTATSTFAGSVQSPSFCITGGDCTSTFSFLSDITGLITAGSNISFSGTGTSGDPYEISATSGGGGGLATTTPWTVNDLAQVVNNGTVRSIATSSLGLPTFADLGTAWGDITGALSSQTDLQTALDAKLSTTTAASTYYLQSNPAGYTTNTGTVTSVGMTVPTGLSVSGSPITTSGTLGLTLTSGYVIPLTASTTQWATAFGWGNHATAGYLDSGDIGVSVQAYDADLTAIAGLATTDSNFIVGNGSTWVAESGSTARTSLGLGSLATLSSVSNTNWSGTDLSVANGGTGLSTCTANYLMTGNGTSAHICEANLTFTGSLLTVTGATNISGLLTAGTIASTTLGDTINGLTAKATPADNDMFGLMDSAASNVLKKLSWSNLLVGIGTWLQGITGYANDYVLTASSTATYGVAWVEASGGGSFQYTETVPLLFERNAGQPVSVYNGNAYTSAAAAAYATIPFKQAIGISKATVTAASLPYPTVVQTTSGTRSGYQGNVTISSVPAGNNYLMLASASRATSVTFTGMTDFSNSGTGSFKSAWMAIGNHAGGDITFPISTGDLGGETINYAVTIVGNATQTAPTELAAYNAESSKAATTTLKSRVYTLMGDNTNTDVTSSVEPNERLVHQGTSQGRAVIFSTPSWQTASTTFTYSRTIRATLVEVAPATAIDFPEAEIVLGGAVTTGLSGLTLRTKYFVSNTGTLATASGTTNLPVGYAVSSSTLMMFQLP